MGSSYNVDLPFASMSRSIGRQNEDIRSRGFSANLARMTDTLAPFALQSSRQRQAARLQEDAQEHSFELARQRLENQKDLADYSLSAAIREDERKEQERITKASKISETMREYFERDKVTGETALGDKSGAEISAETGLPLADIAPYVESNRKAVEAARKSEDHAAEKELHQLNKKKTELALQEVDLRLAAIKAEQAAMSFPERAQLKKTKEALALEKAVIEGEKAKLALEKEKILHNNAAREADIKVSTAEAKLRREAMKAALDQSGMKAAQRDRIDKQMERVTSLATGRMDVYYKNLKKLEEKLPEVALLGDDVKARVVGQINVELAGYNRQARKTNNPQLKFDPDTGLIVTDVRATQAEYDLEDGVAGLAKKVKEPEKIVKGLLNKLPLDDADSKFLTMFNTIMDKAGKPVGDIARGIAFYEAEGERILAERRRREAVSKPRIPRTPEDVPAPPPPPVEEQGELEFLSY